MAVVTRSEQLPLSPPAVPLTHARISLYRFLFLLKKYRDLIDRPDFHILICKSWRQNKLAKYEEVYSFDQDFLRCLIFINTGGQCIQQSFLFLPSSSSVTTFSHHLLSLATFSQMKWDLESQRIIVCNKPRVALHDRAVSKWLTFSK